MSSIRLASLSVALVLAVGACSAGAVPTGPSAAIPSPGSTIASQAPSNTAGPSSAPTPEATPMPTATPFALTSPAFVAGASIPREYTCDGADVSTALDWQGVPAGTAALVLVVTDPDAGGFVHWLVLDVPVTQAGLPRAIPPSADAPQQGRNGFGRVGWGGPCPPSGTHHYLFTLSALAAPLGLAGHPDGATVRFALGRAHVLGQATLVGIYRRG